MEKKATTTPFVYWAQSNEQLFLRVEIEAKSPPKVTTSAKRFEIACHGTAAGSGERDYDLVADLHDEIVPGPSGYRMEILGSRIQFYINKAPDHLGFWPNLLEGRRKPGWLKIDFDRFQSGDADSEEEKKGDGEDRSMRDTVDNLLREVKDEKPRAAAAPLNFKKMYLTAYNTFMFLGFLGVFASIAGAYFRDGGDSMAETYDRVGPNVRLLQFAQALEVVHAAVRLVHSNPLSAALQAVGRLTVLHMIHFQPRLHDSPLVFWLFIAWSLTELIRYPFYLAQVHAVVPKWLKFLRYTTWMLLYPFGMIIETLIIIRSLETYHVSHPTPIFEMAGLEVTWVRVMGTYLCLFPFACFFLLSHMFAQTKTQLFNKNKSKRGGSTGKKVK